MPRLLSNRTDRCTGLFTRIDDGFAILARNGVLYQAHLYHRGAAVFAKHGSGYIRLRKDGQTDVTNTRWREVIIDNPNLGATLGFSTLGGMELS